LSIHVAESVFRIVREHRTTVENLLVYDNVKNMEQYRELMGQLKALEHVEQELRSLLEKQEQLDD
jgi:hypothetical protein